MSLYYGITEDVHLQLGDRQLPDNMLSGGVPPQPVVDAGPEYLITTVNGTIELQGTLINSRQPLENLLIAWSKVSGLGTVAFTNAHALTTEATFSERGLYVLRLAVNDGLLVIGDNIEIVVNCQPEVSAGNDREILLRDTEELVGSLLDSGLGDPSRGEIKLMWELVDGPGTVTFQHDKALRTQATFSKSGSYLLRLTADNGSLEASNEMVVSVAGRVTNSLQALYVFQEGQGNMVRDVSSINAPLPLTILDETKVQWIDGGLALTEPNTLQTTSSVARMIEGMQASNELTKVYPIVQTICGVACVRLGAA
jgi:hypothetical protein